MASLVVHASRRSCHLCFSGPSKGQDNTCQKTKFGKITHFVSTVCAIKALNAIMHVLLAK
uniref:Uncharacterized protein n=1 Tax=Oryza brachyantha TaxID=4533 RepID=J3L9A3_ORYBR